MPRAQVLSIDDYRRRVADDADVERRTYYADLRDDEMHKIRRDCERERGGNLLHLHRADWSVAESDGLSRNALLFASAAFWVVTLLIWFLA